MWLLILEAYVRLVCFDLRFARDFSRMRADLTRRRVHPHKVSALRVQQIPRAVDVACTWYWKQVLCLERSAVTVWMMRERGVPAEMIVGVRHFPFQAHAWVEVDGVVVNDKSSVVETYLILDRI